MAKIGIPAAGCLAGCRAVACGLMIAAVCSGQDVFRENVAPVLQRHCLGCHNDKDQKGGFSLESADSALAGGYIEAGDADGSYLMELITPNEGKAEMPKNGEPLVADEIEAIRRWIDGGAVWPDDLRLPRPPVADLNWWSLNRLLRPALPDPSSGTSDGSRRRLEIRTPIDAFVQQKLDEKGLAASPEADRRTLIRRVCLDLTGLPPTPAEIAAFVADQRPNAWELLVDQLLQSPHYGECQARHWLDVVHYADTHGYDKDKPRPNAWPYRDYVIRAFNEDKPWSRFVREQIAGDALWPDSVDGIVATGFIAAGPWDFIGHEEVPESKFDGKVARNLDRDDMVTSTFNSFCSTTVSCARCHDHKFDPVTQENYYSLQAVFAALDRADRSYDADPGIARQRKELAARRQNLTLERAVLNQTIEAAAGEELAEIDRQISELQLPGGEAIARRPEYGYHSAISDRQDVVKWVQVDLDESRPIERIVFVGCDDAFNQTGAGFGFPLRYKIEVSNDADFTSGVVVLDDSTKADVENPGTTPQVREAAGGVAGRYVRFTATRLAERQNDFIFALAEMTVLDRTGNNVALGKDVASLDSIEAPPRWQRRNLVDGTYFSDGQSSERKERIAALGNARKQLLERVTDAALRERLNTLDRELAGVAAAVLALPEPARVYCGSVYTGSGNFAGTGGSGGLPRPVHVLNRGDVNLPLAPVAPGTIPVIAGLDWRFALDDSAAESQRRIALADWLVRDDNPLTWRSIVNRIWQYHFGRGIVDSPNDFGRMGQLPSHPELLDWLAVDFRDAGQSIKELHRQILLSSVYRQSSLDDAANHEIDSQNVYLWRMSRRRLTAEELRDSVLAISGKLDRGMYGPGFHLFEVERPEHSPHYEYDKSDPADPATWRRSIYRFTVRSQPDPFMTTLDCADSSQSVAKRDETITALQALTLLNNPFMLQMSRYFAERIRQDSGNLAEQVALAFERVTGRPPSDDASSELVAFAQEYGLENVCRVLFNLNEFVFVD